MDRAWYCTIGTIIVEALFLLVTAPFKRQEVSKQPENAIHTAEFLRHLRDQFHQEYGYMRREVTTILVDGLALQVILKAENVREKMGEMADLCLEVLTSEMSGVDATRNVTPFPEHFCPKGVHRPQIENWIKVSSACKWRGSTNRICARFAFPSLILFAIATV